MAVLTNTGEAEIIDAILAAVTLYAEWGTGSTAPAKTDTDVETTSTEARVACTPTDNGDDADFVATITAAGARAITEVAFFDHLTTGNIWVRDTFTTINLATSDSIEFTLNLEIA